MRRQWLQSLWERFSIYMKLPVLYLVTLLIATVYFSVYGYHSTTRLMLDALDRRLELATVAVELVLPEDYADRAIAPHGITPDEYARVQHLMKRIADTEGIYSLYALNRVDGRFYTVASNYENYRQPYDDAWEELELTAADGQARFDNGVDSFGSFRSIIRRFTSPAGRHYFVGADTPLAEIEGILSRQRRHYLLTGLLSFFLVGMVSIWVVWMITTPLKKLSDLMENFSRNNFSFKDDRDSARALLPLTPNPSDEVRLLARNFHAMQGELSNYLERLTATAAAKERAESEMRIAGEIQQGLLSQTPVETDRVSIWGAMIPAREAAGDFYDTVRLDDEWMAFTIGDVSGKGVPAAMFMATCLTLFRAHVKGFDSREHLPGDFLREIVNEIDRELAAHNETVLFVTAQMGMLNLRSGEVLLANAGHPAPVRGGADGGWSFLEVESGSVLGIGLPHGEESLSRFSLSPGESLILYTDGLPEAMSPGDELFGEPRILGELDHLSGGNVRETVEGLFDAMRRFSDTREQYDDLAIVCIRWKG